MGTSYGCSGVAGQQQVAAGAPAPQQQLGVTGAYQQAPPTYSAYPAAGQAASYPPPVPQPQYGQAPAAYAAPAGPQMGGGGAQAAGEAQRLLAGAAHDLQEALAVLKKGGHMSGEYSQHES